MHEGRKAVAEHGAEHARQHRLAATGRAGQQRAAAAILDHVTQFQQCGLMRLGRVVELRIGQVLERLLPELPIGFIHDGNP